MVKQPNRTLFKRLKKEVRPLKIPTSNQAFVKEWLACRHDSKRNLTKLTYMLEPFVKEYAKMIFYQDVPKDINFVSMCSLLEAEEKYDFQSILEKYISVTGNLEDIEQEIWLSIFVTLRKLKFNPDKAKDIMTEYAIVLNWKGRYKNYIRNSSRKWRYYIDLIDITKEDNLDLIHESIDLYKFIAIHPQKHYIIWLLDQTIESTKYQDNQFLKEILE